MNSSIRDLADFNLKFSKLTESTGLVTLIITLMSFCLKGPANSYTVVKGVFDKKNWLFFSLNILKLSIYLSCTFLLDWLTIFNLRKNWYGVVIGERVSEINTFYFFKSTVPPVGVPSLYKNSRLNFPSCQDIPRELFNIIKFTKSDIRNEMRVSFTFPLSREFYGSSCVQGKTFQGLFSITRIEWHFKSVLHPNYCR